MLSEIMKLTVPIRKKLRISLSDYAPYTGFYKGSVGKFPNEIYGLPICFGHTTTLDCAR